MAHLPALAASDAQRLDAWLKGPVYYGSEVRLRASVESDSRIFALVAASEERPAMLGRRRRAGPAESLLPQQRSG